MAEDNLGTPRIVTDKDGDIISRSDYMPYGEEIIGYGNRTSTDKYQADDIRQGFTGYEKDDETGLDYAQARMYNNSLGRFTSTDPINLKANRLVDPQRINLYGYTRNNPLTYIDPDGMDVKMLDSKARQRVLSTLPKNIRKQVGRKINKNGLLKRGALNKIKSENANFLDLKAMVNRKRRVFVKTDSKDNNGKEFYYDFESKEDQFAADVADLAKAKVDDPDTEVEMPNVGDYNDVVSKIDGKTFIDSDGNITVIIADGTGGTAEEPEKELAEGAAHELYVHGYRAQRGKQFGHELDAKGVPIKAGPKAPVNQKTVEVRKRTYKMYENQ